MPPKLADVQRLDRALLLEACPPDAAPVHVSSSDDDATQRAWLDQATAWMFGESLVEAVDEPPFDALVTVPMGIGHTEVDELSGMLQRLLRRDVIIHPVAG